jgi:hypothetical protein
MPAWEVRRSENASWQEGGARLSRSLTRSLSPQAAEKVLPGVQPDTHIINAILVKLMPGADRAEVSRHIETWLYFSTFTTAEETQLMLKGRLA